MKTSQYIYVLFTSIFAFSFTSCSDFLEVEAVGKQTIPDFFSDMSGIRSAVAGMYSETYNYYCSEFYKYPEVAGNMVDLKTVSSDADMLNQYNFTSSPEDEAKAVGYIWKKIFVALANTNNILQYQPSLLSKFRADSTELNNIKAQALFIRALCHFDLCRVYAQPYNYTADASHLGIPVLLKTPGADDNVARSSVKVVYNQIIADLKESERLFGLTSATDTYHASFESTKALLSRVYLYSEDWDNCIKYSSEVIDSVKLAQGENYFAMYTNMVAGSESIFRLNGTLKTKTLGAFYSVKNPVAIAADTLIKLYDDPADIRLRLFVPLSTGSNKYVTQKFTIKVDYTDKQEHYDPIVLRASEMYLNRAEAYLNKDELEKAAEDIKILVARSLNKNVSEVTIKSDNKNDLAKIIEKERAKELCFEGHNFFDIIRRKKDLIRCKTSNSNVKFMSYPNDRFILPIPQTELDANTNMVGNPTVNK